MKTAGMTSITFAVSVTERDALVKLAGERGETVTNYVLDSIAMRARHDGRVWLFTPRRPGNPNFGRVRYEGAGRPRKVKNAEKAVGE